MRLNNNKPNRFTLVQVQKTEEKNDKELER